jgi:hypothetical protein
VASLSTGFEAGEASSFVLKQQDPGRANLLAPAPGVHAAMGKYGAAVTVTKSGDAPWHVQLSSASAQLVANKYYTLKFNVRSNKESTAQAALIQDATWQVGFDMALLHVHVACWHIMFHCCHDWTKLRLAVLEV